MNENTLNIDKIKKSVNFEMELEERMNKNLSASKMDGEKLCQSVRIGENCPKVKTNPGILGASILGPNSKIHKPKADELAKDVRNALDKAKQNYEMVNHPKHYNNYDVEVVDMMERIWGTKATIEWCKMTAYKYRMRMGTKPGENDSPEAMKNKLLEDFNKEQWYLNKAKELSDKKDATKLRDIIEDK